MILSKLLLIERFPLKMLKLHRIAETLDFLAHQLKFLIYVKLHYFQIYQVTQNGSLWTWTSAVPEFSWSQQSLERFKEIVQLFSSQEKSSGKMEKLSLFKKLVI